jgi:competence protein ComEA
MRQRLAHARDLVTRTLRESAWAPLVGRALAITAGVLLLAAIGAGWLDGSLDLGTPRAEAAATTRRRSPPQEREVATTTTPSSSAPSPAPSPPAVASASPPRDAGPPSPAPTTPDGKVILNAAGERDLDRLPGVGPARARAIVALRDKLGGKFKRFEDLLRVRGIGRRSLERIRAHAVLDPPPPEEIAPPAG